MVTRIKRTVQAALNMWINANPIALFVLALILMITISWCVFVCTF